MIKKFKEDLRFNLLFLFTFVTAVILVYSTYAWFSSALNVIISDFKMTTDSKDGLYISLDGITWTDELDITKNNLLFLLTETYPNHETQWANELGPTSTVRIDDSNKNRFTFYSHYKHNIVYPNYNNTDVMSFYVLEEKGVNSTSPFMAFDVFIKNTTPSPYADNLYLGERTSFSNSDPENTDDTGLNALRLGIIFSDVTSVEDDINNIQRLSCNNNCKDYIFEPNADRHTENSLKALKKHGVDLNDREYYETYGMHFGESKIKIWSGVRNPKVPIDSKYYRLQDTTTDINAPMFQLPKGIVKARVYMWVEGQDVDIIEHISKGYKVSVSLNFRKDHASLN